MKSDINIIFLIKSFFSIWPKNQDKHLNILRTKRAFKMKQKIFFIVSKGLSATETKFFFGRWESATLRPSTVKRASIGHAVKRTPCWEREKNVCIKLFLNRFMLLLIICNNNNSFVLLWLWIIIAITLFIQNIFIYWYFWYFLKSPVTFTLTSIYTLSTLSTFILHPHFYIYISFHHIG